MFTGIVATSCEVVATEQGEEVRSIVVDLSGYDDDLEIGASVAIDGVCMTVVSAIDGHVRFEAIPETCLLYTSPSPRDVEESRMPSSA